MKKLLFKSRLIFNPLYVAIFVLLFGINFLKPIYGSELGVPWADPNVKNKVPFKNIKKIAQLKAEVLWGKTTIGSIIPYSDIDGKIMAYLFTFYIGGQQFPSYHEISGKINNAVVKLPSQKNNGKDWQQNFGYIVLSATYDQVPIIEYANHLPQYYLKGEQAKAVATLKLGSVDPKLVHIYYGGPLEQWFEFVGKDETILVDAYTLRSYTKDRLVKVSDQNNKVNEAIKNRINKAWKSLEKFDPSSSYCALDSNVIDGVPFYTWSYGCSPTASAMLMGYWDERGYGRLVDYFFDHPDVAVGQTIYNVPNIQKELAIEMNTDTTTGGTIDFMVSVGQTWVANNINGYSFVSVLFPGDDWNDWNWNLIKSEIGAGRPFHWMVYMYYRIGPHHGEIDTIWPCNHSIAAIGYVDNGALENDFVIVHDTWNAYVTYWALYTADSGYSYSDVVTLVPDGAQLNNVELTFPTGGEVLISNSPYNITWTSTGSDIGHCALYYSSDNCQNWQTINGAVPNTGFYTWTTPGSDLENVRVKIDAHNSLSELLADDASRDNFQMASGDVSGIDTIAYENYSPYYVDALPTVLNGYPLDYYNVRFTPIDDCSLLAAQFYFARKGGTGWTLRAYVWSDNEGLPDQLIDSVDVPEDSIYTRHNDDTLWTRAHFADKGIKFPKFQDFHIGYSLIGAGPGDSLPVVADYGFTNRSSVYWNDGFVTLHSLTNGGHNYFIDAVVSYDVVIGTEEEQPKIDLPVILSLDQIYPNPCYDRLVIRYQIAEEIVNNQNSVVSMKIYDATGRLVRQFDNATIRRSDQIIWPGTDDLGRKLPPGIYIVRLQVNNITDTKKIVMID
jgi:hypothetical protein